jgi:hypothetical protein
MFGKGKAAKLAAAEAHQATEEARSMAADLPDADGHVSIEDFQRFFQFALDHNVDLSLIPNEWRTVRLGMAQAGYFIDPSTSLLLKRNECALFDARADLLKEVADREFRGGSRGVSIPLAHGVRLRTGAVRGHMVTIGTHWTPADSGVLTVTDRRVVYHGGRKTLEFPFAKLATLNVYTDALDIGVTSRQSTSSFRVVDPELVAGMIHAGLDWEDQEVTILKLTADGG